MEKKKVAILLPWLKMGGTNKVALRFARELSHYCDVTLILSQNTGELLCEVPEGVRVIIDDVKGFKEVLKADCKHLRIAYIIKDCLYYLKIKCGRDSVDNYAYLMRRQADVCKDVFDCAITYHGQSPERLLNLVYRVKANKKVAWIHGEMSFSKERCRQMAKYYAQMDHFFFVSGHTRESFAKAVPLEHMVSDVYYNPLDKQEILSKSTEHPEELFDKTSFNIVTVGRVSSEKGQDMIPEITKKLVAAGCNAVWYVIGDGPELALLSNRVQLSAMDDHIKLLGVKNNPYCYMRLADLYVQPSYTEGYSTTICEAGILGKAIVGTKPSGGIYDQITDGVDGLIVDATVDGLFEGIFKLYRNESLRHSFENKIQLKNFEGKGEIRKFLDFLNE